MNEMVNHIIFIMHETYGGRVKFALHNEFGDP